MRQKQSREGVPLRRFSEEEDRVIAEMIASHRMRDLAFIAAAERLCRSVDSVKGRFHWLIMPEFQRERRNKNLQAKRKAARRG